MSHRGCMKRIIAVGGAAADPTFRSGRSHVAIRHQRAAIRSHLSAAALHCRRRGRGRRRRAARRHLSHRRQAADLIADGGVADIDARYRCAKSLRQGSMVARRARGTQEGAVAPPSSSRVMRSSLPCSAYATTASRSGWRTRPSRCGGGDHPLLRGGDQQDLWRDRATSRDVLRLVRGEPLGVIAPWNFLS